MSKSKQKTQQTVKLSSKREKFCREYIIDRNATQAYIRAGYSQKGASQSSERLLRNADIKNCIDELQAEEQAKLSEKYKISRERIMKQRGLIAFFNIRDLYDAKGNFKNPAEWDDDTASCIASVKYKTRTEGAGYGVQPEISEVRLWNKDAALTALEKIEGLYLKDNEQLNPYASMTREELWEKVDKLHEKTLQQRAQRKKKDS